MSRHQRLQKTLRSPIRRRKHLRNRQTRTLRRAVNAAFDKVIAPHFPQGFHVSRVPVVTPEQRFRQLMKAKRREKCDQEAKS